MHIRRRPRRPRPWGFTLIESLIGLTIVGILACIAYGLLGRGSRDEHIAAYMTTLHRGQPYGVSCKSVGPLIQRCDVSLVGTTQVIALSCDTAGCAKATGVMP